MIYTNISSFHCPDASCVSTIIYIYIIYIYISKSIWHHVSLLRKQCEREVLAQRASLDRRPSVFIFEDKGITSSLHLPCDVTQHYTIPSFQHFLSFRPLLLPRNIRIFGHFLRPKKQPTIVSQKQDTNGSRQFKLQKREPLGHPIKLIQRFDLGKSRKKRIKFMILRKTNGSSQTQNGDSSKTVGFQPKLFFGQCHLRTSRTRHPVEPSTLEVEIQDLGHMHDMSETNYWQVPTQKWMVSLNNKGNMIWCSMS